ncbi:MAG: T9SS type A sorting domain-containing protein [Bacteroidia bacterium]
MKSLLLLIGCLPLIGFSQMLSNTSTINISKIWDQEPNGRAYPIFVNVPQGDVPQGGFPICILLHGKGGNGAAMINQFQSKITCHVLVAPSGYQNSWNISDEESEAPDIEMMEDLIDSIQMYENINPNQIRILGISNGAGLANRVFVENSDPGVDMVCAVVTQLSEAQYRNGNFYYPNGPTGGTDPYDGYNDIITPINGRKYLNICNDNDPIIPYLGGPGVGVNFLPAQEAIYIIAQSQGYLGSQISGSGTSLGSDVYEYSYMNDSVVHLKGHEGHSINLIQENYLNTFLKDCNNFSNLKEEIGEKWNIYPNPTNAKITISANITQPVPYEVISIAGQTLLRGKLNAHDKNIDLSHLAVDIYFLRIANQTIKITKLD